MSAPLFIEPTAATAPALASAAGSSAGFVADFIQVAAGVHAVDLNAILRPFWKRVCRSLTRLHGGSFLYSPPRTAT